MKTYLFGSLALGIVLACGASARANLIVNGSFEDGHFDSHGAGSIFYNPVPEGNSTKVTGWTALENGFKWCKEGDFGPTAFGSMMVSLTYGDTTGGISQTFDTVAGQQYQLSFILGAPSLLSDMQITRLLNVSVAGGTYQFTKAPSGTWPMTWDMETLVFTAVSTTTTLDFLGGTSISAGSVIDNVVVEPIMPVPEPATYLAGLGLLALWGAAARRK